MEGEGRRRQRHPQAPAVAPESERAGVPLLRHRMHALNHGPDPAVALEDLRVERLQEIEYVALGRRHRHGVADRPVVIQESQSSGHARINTDIDHDSRSNAISSATPLCGEMSTVSVRRAVNVRRPLGPWITTVFGTVAMQWARLALT